MEEEQVKRLVLAQIGFNICTHLNDRHTSKKKKAELLQKCLKRPQSDTALEYAKRLKSDLGKDFVEKIENVSNTVMAAVTGFHRGTIVNAMKKDEQAPKPRKKRADATTELFKGEGKEGTVPLLLPLLVL
jgi:hypothetical protein